MERKSLLYSFRAGNAHIRQQILAYYSNVIMSTIASQITGVSIVWSTVCLGADQRNTKALRHWHLWGKFTDDRWIPRTKGQ